MYLDNGKWCKRTIADTTKASERQPSEETQARWRIAELEEALRSTDYKVIKIAEAQAVGEALPYTAEEIKALRNEREAARAEINALQDKFNV